MNLRRIRKAVLGFQRCPRSRLLRAVSVVLHVWLVVKVRRVCWRAATAECSQIIVRRPRRSSRSLESCQGLDSARKGVLL